MKQSLHVKMMLLLVVITTIALILVGGTNYYMTKASLLDSLEKQTAGTVKSAATNLNDWLSVRLNQAQVISRTSVIRTGNLEEQFRYMSREFNLSESYYYSIGIADLAGNLTTTSGHTINIAEESSFQAARSGQWLISDPFFEKINGEYVFTIMVPVFDDLNQVVEVLDFAYYADKTFKDRIQIENTDLSSTILVVNRATTILYSHNIDNVLTSNCLCDTPYLKPYIDQAIRQENGFVSLNYEGAQQLVFYAKIANANWYLIFSIVQDAFEKPLQRLFWVTIIIICCTEIVLAGLIFYIYNTVILRRLKDILGVTEEVAGGNLTIKPLETRSQDELGLLAGSVNGMLQNLRDLFDPFESFIQNNRYAMVVINAQYQIISFNERAEEMLGYQAEDVIKKATPLLWLDPIQLLERSQMYSKELGTFIPPDCSTLVAKAVRKMSMDQEWAWINASGMMIPVTLNVSTMTHSDGSIKGFVLLARDISRLREATEMSSRLLNIVEAAQDLIASFDMKGNIFYINPAGMEFLEIEQLNDETRHIGNYITAQMTINLLDGLKIAMEKGFWETETEFVTCNQKRIFTSQTIVAHDLSDGGETYFSTIVRDISDQKRAQLELIQAKEEADKANHAKTLFLARMSHEIRTPLNGILGLTHLMKRTDLSEVQRDHQNKIEISSQTLLQVINDILDFSKIEAEKLTIEKVNFNLDELLRRLCGTLSILMGYKPIDFIIHADLPVAEMLIGDSMRLEQILLNLCSNAIKFTESGSIELRVKVESAAENSLTLSFEVQDTGIGMTNEQILRLFEPFVQADETTSRKYGGTGLGLVICKSLIETMNGQLNVKSKPGKGTTFWFSLAFDKGMFSRNHIFSFPVELPAYRVLIVEDCPAMRLSIESMLQCFNLPAYGVASWNEATYVIEQGDQKIDFVLLDMEAEDMYGEETWLNMKKITDQRGLLTIAITTLSGRDALQQLPNDRKPDAILLKPLNRIELYQSILNVHESMQEVTKAKVDADKEDVEMEMVIGSVLLVEDNLINQTVAVELLRSRGALVTVANNGREALNILEVRSFDLILMDLHMPIMDGFETTEAIRAEGRYQQSPIVALTADVTNIQHDACYQLGMNDIITKPIDPVKLNEVLSKWLQVPHIPECTSQEANSIGIHGVDLDQAVRRMDGKMNLVIQMLHMFNNQYERVCDQIRAFIEEEDYTSARRLTHSLRGAAGNLSVSDVFDISSELEIALEEIRKTELSVLINQLETALQEVALSMANLESASQ